MKPSFRIPHWRPVRRWLLIYAGLCWTCASGVLCAHGEYHQRVGELEGELAKAPDSPELHRQLASAHAGHDEWILCLKEVGIIERLSGEDAGTCHLRGLAWAGLKETGKALAALNRSLTLRPDQAPVLAARGRVKLAMLDFPGAIADLDRAALLEPTPEAFLDLAKACLAAGRETDAIQALERGMAKFGPHPELAGLALEIESAAGAWDSALKRIDSLMAQAPRPEPWMARRARLLAGAGRPLEAAAAWRDLKNRLLGLPSLERGSPLLSGLLAEARAALGEESPAPVIAAPAPSPNRTIAAP